MVASQGLARGDPQQIHQIFSAFRQSQDQALRERLVLAHAPRAAALARRFANRGEPIDDLIQVATIGLLKAVDRFDPTRGVQFSTYATATILGELRRHFRDRFWTIRVSRRLRELNHRLMRAGDRLAQELGRTPTVAEMARECGVGLERALEAFEVGRAYRPASLDAPVVDGGEETGRPGADDPALQGVEDRMFLERASTASRSDCGRRSACGITRDCGRPRWRGASARRRWPSPGSSARRWMCFVRWSAGMTTCRPPHRTGGRSGAATGMRATGTRATGTRATGTAARGVAAGGRGSSPGPGIRAPSPRPCPLAARSEQFWTDGRICAVLRFDQQGQ